MLELKVWKWKSIYNMQRSLKLWGERKPMRWSRSIKVLHTVTSGDEEEEFWGPLSILQSWMLALTSCWKTVYVSFAVQLQQPLLIRLLLPWLRLSPRDRASWPRWPPRLLGWQWARLWATSLAALSQERSAGAAVTAIRSQPSLRTRWEVEGGQHSSRCSLPPGLRIWSLLNNQSLLFFKIRSPLPTEVSKCSTKKANKKTELLLAHE